MKFFLSFSKFQIIILIINIFSSLDFPLSKKEKKPNYINTDNNDKKTNFSPKKLSNEICNIKNCLSCENRNECIKCKEDYILDKKRCYSTNCQIYGFCKFCDEYDCLKCDKGYKLNYGICELKEVSRKKFYLIIFINICLIIFIIYICVRYRQIARIKIATGQVIKFIHPKSGFYQLHYEVKNETLNDSDNKVRLQSSVVSPDKIDKDVSPMVDSCVICRNKTLYAIADCGCSICFNHFKIIRKKHNMRCPIHNVFITSNISFKMAERSKIQGNALEKLGLQKCPICKINEGTQSFNCGCTMRVCEKCFNDNVYVFKYNQCPGCGQKYNPIKFTRRWNKNQNEPKNKMKIKEENGGTLNDK